MQLGASTFFFIPSAPLRCDVETFGVVDRATFETCILCGCFEDDIPAPEKCRGRLGRFLQPTRPQRIAHPITDVMNFDVCIGHTASFDYRSSSKVKHVFIKSRLPYLRQSHLTTSSLFTSSAYLLNGTHALRPKRAEQRLASCSCHEAVAMNSFFI